MKKIEFTPARRALLVNQFQILALLDPEQKQHYEHLANIARSGYTRHYREIEGHINTEGLPEDVAQLTHDILNMFDRLQYSVKGNPELSKFTKDVEFHGFDGNNESEYLHYASFLAGLPNSAYRELNVRNSHMPTLQRYGRMLAQFEKSGKNDTPLSANQVEDILAAGTPSPHLKVMK